MGFFKEFPYFCEESVQYIQSFETSIETGNLQRYNEQSKDWSNSKEGRFSKIEIKTYLHNLVHNRTNK